MAEPTIPGLRTPNRSCAAWLSRALVVTLLLLDHGVALAADDESPPLATKIQELTSDYRGDVGVYAKHLDSGREFGHHADDLFATASVCKVPVMIELFRLADQGKLSLDDRVRFDRRGISTHGTGLLKHLKDAPELTLRDYCRLMIVISDNMATDTLMRIAKPEAVTATMKNLGFPQTRVNGNLTTMHYRMAGITAEEGTPENDELLIQKSRAWKLLPQGVADRTLKGNVTTPREMGRILEKLDRGEIVSPQASREMIEILKGTTSRSTIPRDLDPLIAVAHKVGGTYCVKADVGIVYHPAGPIVVSVFSYHDPDETRAREVLPEIAALLIKEFSSP